MTAEQGTTEVIYQNNERVKIIKEHGLDYLIEDVSTGKQYLIDKTYFAKRYTSEEERLPVHTDVWERIQVLSADNYSLRRAIIKLRGTLKGERKKLAAALDKKKERQHYRNGQKRGRTRNG